jgi:hypothetical protein
MLLYKIKDPKGDLKPDLTEGDYAWIAEKDFANKVTNYFENKAAFDHQVEVLNNFKGQVIFEETDYYGGNF